MGSNGGSVPDLASLLRIALHPLDALEKFVVGIVNQDFFAIFKQFVNIRSTFSDDRCT